MTPCDSLHSQPYPFKHTPFMNGVNRILRATRRVPAMRAQHRRKRKLVKPNGQDENFLQHVGSLVNGVRHLSVLAVHQLYADLFQLVADAVRKRVVFIRARFFTEIDQHFDNTINEFLVLSRFFL